MIDLSMLKVGEEAKVLGFHTGSKVYRQKLLSMGLTRGTTFKVVRKAPMGDPVQIDVRGFSLSLRKQEAGVLEIEKINQ